jgi:uncharacterized protein (TIGR00730 family)
VLERREFIHTDPWRVLRIMGEFVEGFHLLADVQSAVSIFGSARTPPSDPMYPLAADTARRLGEQNFAIITGAGPGIMEAANKGAREAGVLSIGLNIEIPNTDSPFAQGPNAYVDRLVNFRFFFARKTMLVKYSSAFLFFPGGFGTLDELFEALTLVQTGRIHNIPVVLVGRDYWRMLTGWLADVVAREAKISSADLEHLHVSDDPDEVVDIVVEARRRRLVEQMERA